MVSSNVAWLVVLSARSCCGSRIDAVWLTWPATLKTTSQPVDDIGDLRIGNRCDQHGLDVDTVELVGAPAERRHERVDDPHARTAVHERSHQVGADEAEAARHDAGRAGPSREWPALREHGAAQYRTGAHARQAPCGAVDRVEDRRAWTPTNTAAWPPPVSATGGTWPPGNCWNSSSLPHLAPPTTRTRYLDAAGGSGATGRWLAARAPTLVDDVDEDSVRYAAGAGYRPVVADLNALPHPDRVVRCRALRDGVVPPDEYRPVWRRCVRWHASRSQAVPWR